MDEERYREHLREREGQNYASTRRWNATPNKGGMIGEKAQAEFFGAEPDLRNRPKGDRGVDLEVSLDGGSWHKLDAKYASDGEWLKVEVDKLREDVVYVLVNPRGECVGWETGRRMKDAPIYQRPGMGRNHEKKHLQPMEDLKERYDGWWRHVGLPARRADYPPPPPPPPNLFIGRCACGGPGLYHALGEWFCNEHRRY